jgi:hypothetical protein
MKPFPLLFFSTLLLSLFYIVDSRNPYAATVSPNTSGNSPTSVIKVTGSIGEPNYHGTLITFYRTPYPEDVPDSCSPNQIPEQKAEQQLNFQQNYFGCKVVPNGTELHTDGYHVGDSCLWIYGGDKTLVNCSSNPVDSAVIKKTTYENIWNDCEDIKCNFQWLDMANQKLYVGRIPILIWQPIAK